MILGGIFLFSFVSTIDEHAYNEEGFLLNKQKGAHIFGPIDSISMCEFHNLNIEWITLVSWGFQENVMSGNIVHHHGDSAQMWQRDSQWVNRINTIRENGFKVFLKPHIWIDEVKEGEWRSEIHPHSADGLKLWQVGYREFILRYAAIAAKSHVDMFCIGTEFTKMTKLYPEYWSALIKEVRAVYKGPLVYAANWYKEYEQVTFWDELDFIGVQAYFPLVDHDNPTSDQLRKGWKKYRKSLKKMSNSLDKRIIFTEMGYKSTSDGASRPWEWIDYSVENEENYSLLTQANCYSAFFEMVWPQEWFAGVHLWQMRSDDRRDERWNKYDFTPLNKPAERIIQEEFGKP